MRGGGTKNVPGWGQAAGSVEMRAEFPSSLDAESAVLGAILLDNDVYKQVAEVLISEDFSHDGHRRIFARMAALGQEGVGIDPVTLTEELVRTGELEAVGGPSYMASLTEGLPRSVNAIHYASLVKEKAIRRKVMRAGQTLIDRASDSGTELAYTLDYLQKAGREIVSAQHTDGVWAERKLPFRTAAQIETETPATVDWIASPWVAAGAITELDGKVKAAGKTTLLLEMCRAILDGEPFMDELTSTTPIVYLTEQNSPSFRVAMERAGLLGRDDFIVLAWADTVGVRREVVVQKAVSECKRRGARLLVVDTMAQFAGLQGDAENNAGNALEAIRPLQLAAAEGLGVVFSRHERKSGGEVGDSGRGSSAFGGAVDSIVTLRRPEGRTRPTVREIRAISRFSEVPNELFIELTSDGYVAHGTEGALAAKEAEEAILSALPKQENEALELNRLREVTGVARSTAQRAIQSLVDQGKAFPVGEGKKGDLVRYYAPEIHSAQTTSPIGAERNAETNEPSTRAVPLVPSPAPSGTKDDEGGSRTEPNVSVPPPDKEVLEY